MRHVIFSLGLFASLAIRAQYAAPAGQPGTSALHRDSSAFITWATACDVERGNQDISDPSLGTATVGTTSMATGKADLNGVISLGDGGKATCTFAYHIVNGPGPDFAVFENSITDDFLELAFVEVSSDGINFFRFASHSLTDTSAQTSSFGATDTRKVNNLAGKYRMGYGTPFDLDELKNNTGLNVNAVTHVRVVDVVGSVNPAFAARDSYNNMINDPWPTPFPSGGFDLDAIGVINRSLISGTGESLKEASVMYPNPAACGSEVRLSGLSAPSEIIVADLKGLILLKETGYGFSTAGFKPGVYLVKLDKNDTPGFVKLILY